MSNELCKCGKVGKISCPNDERCTQLPVEVVADLNEKAELSTDMLSNDEAKSRDYLKGYEQGWKEGATEYATKLHTLQSQYDNDMKANNEAISRMREEFLRVKERCDKMEAALNMVYSKGSGAAETIKMVNEAFHGTQPATPSGPCLGENGKCVDHIACENNGNCKWPRKEVEGGK